MLSTSPRQQTSITAERGYPLAIGVAFTKEDDEPLDLTGSSVWFDLRALKRKGGEQLISQRDLGLDTPSTLGRAFLALQGDDLDRAPGLYDFDITVRSAGGFSAIVVKGQLEIVENANSLGTADFALGPESATLEVQLLKRNRITVRVNHYPDEKLAAYSQLAAASASTAAIAAEQAQAAAADADASAEAAEAALQAATDLQVDIGNALTSAVADATAQAAASAAAASDSATTAYSASQVAGQESSFATQAKVAAEAAAASIGSTAADVELDRQAAENSATWSQQKAAESELARDAAQAAAADAATYGMRIVLHGSNPDVPRPDVALVYWVGTALPSNGEPYDFWKNT